MTKLYSLIFALAATTFANAAELPRYQALDIGTLGGKNSFGIAINGAGQVTGNADTADGEIHAFLYTNGRMIDLGTLGGTFSTGTDINEAGQVTGDAATSDHFGHAFLYANGTMINLGQLPGGCCSAGTALNESGQVAGFSWTTGDIHAFLYQDGEMSDLGTFGGSQSQAQDINDAGDVVGDANTAGNASRRPFVYRNGELLDLGSLGGDSSLTTDINESGQVVGESRTDSSSGHAFLYTDGSMIDLGTLGGGFSRANALNNAGEVAGSAARKDNRQGHAFLFSQGLMVDLGAMLGAKNSGAWDINNQGQVTGEVFRADGGYAFVYSDGEARNVNDLVAGLFPRPVGPKVLIQGVGGGNQIMNDRGQILARANFSDQRRHAVLLTPITLLFEQLIAKVIGADLNESLLNKVRESFSHYSAGRKPGTCSKLKDFILKVESLRGTSVPTPDARTLLLGARAVRQAVGCS